MSSTTGAATRGAAADNRDDPRRGRLTGPAWRDVARAVRLGKKSDAYSVEVHGVRIVFKMSVPKPSQETCGGKAQERPARRRQEPTTSVSAVRKDNELNSAQRRNAKRLQEYLQLKGAHGQGVVHSSGSTSEDAWSLRRPNLTCATPRQRIAKPRRPVGVRSEQLTNRQHTSTSPHHTESNYHTRARRDRRTRRRRPSSTSRRSTSARLNVVGREGPSPAASAAVGTRAPTACHCAGVSSQGGTST